MISRIIKKTQGAHSSPSGKTPKGSSIQTLKPSPYVEQPQRVTIPLEIRTYRRSPTTTVHVLEKPRQWMYGKSEPVTQPTARTCNMQVCKWYRRRRAIKQLALYQKREKERALKDRIERERHELEQKAFEHFKRQALHKQYEIPSSPTSFKLGELPKKKFMDRYHEREKERIKKKSLERERKELEKRALECYKEQQQYQTASTTKEKKKRKKKKNDRERKELEKQALQHFKMQESYKSVSPKTKVKKPKKVKIAKSYAKPKTMTRAVTEKRLSRYDDIGVRFTNCFYRFCCQLYCCFTCILIIGFVVIVIL